MRSTLKILCVLATVVCTVATIRSASAATPRSYPMMCRGGGAIYFSLAVSAASGDLIIHINFARGTAGGNPGPGQCTWLDRGMRPDEPTELVYQAADTQVVPFIKANRTISRFNYGGRSRSQFEYLIDSILNGKAFQVHAYQQRLRSGNNFKIVRVGP